jgi:predicted lipoprotein with Yx(FWY)xxD motif
MNWKLTLNGAIAGAALMVAACGSYSTSSYGSSTAPPSSNGRYPGVVSSPPAGTPAPSGAAAASIALRSTPLGQILVDSSGRTLYLFEADKVGMSTCYGSCASVWPPLLASGTPVAGAGLDQMLLTTTARKDGSLEIVYNGHPLYYFVSDKQPGDTSGQALSSFGADWYVLSAGGTKVDKG